MEKFMWVGNSVTALNPAERLVAGARWDGSLREIMPGLLVVNEACVDAAARAQLLPANMIGRRVVSHTTAAWIHLGGKPPVGIHVIGTSRAVDNLLMPHRQKISEADVVEYSGIRVTTVERTIFDVAREKPDRDLLRRLLAIHNPHKLQELLCRLRGKRNSSLAMFSISRELTAVSR